MGTVCKCLKVRSKRRSSRRKWRMNLEICSSFPETEIILLNCNNNREHFQQKKKEERCGNLQNWSFTDSYLDSGLFATSRTAVALGVLKK